ncbi:MAG TPA: glycosyltransferase 87 family protein [Streptosporangiaceae bacterium]|nr:glycosyltransferase 87 family protein [Streptosporangiaceae bacterium]
MDSAGAAPPAPVPGAAEGLRSVLRGRRARAVAYGCLLAELGLVIGFAIAYRPFDLSIYLWGGSAVTHGMRLYLVAPRGNWFTYPPFAAAVFTPLAALPPLVVGVVWELASVAALAWSCLLALKLAGWQPSGAMVAAVTGAGFLLEPVYHTLYLGQVNLILLALVMTDIWRTAAGRAAGLGVGVAAAIKLTPAIFVVLFLLTRRTRSAVVAAGTFAGCAALGYLVDPSASRVYWTRLFYDTARVNAGYISNQSPYAAVVRILGGVSHVGAWYVAIPVVIGALGLAVAATLARRDDWLGAAAVAGTTGLLVSPVSWTHHWVWIMPALLVLLLGGTGSRIAAACGYLLFVLAPMWWTPWTWTTSETGFHGLTTLTANCFLIAGLAFLGYMGVRTWRLEPRPREGRELALPCAPSLGRLATSDAAGTLSSYDLS